MFPTNTLTNNHKPVKWSTTNFDYSTGHVLVPLESYAMEYREIAAQLTDSFNKGIKSIMRVENPFLYGQFLLKQEEYRSRGKNFEIKVLFHDTANCKIDSIVTHNFDWRLTNRAKFGKGVSFSPSPSYANRQSSRSNGTDRAMVLTDVLIGSQEAGSAQQSLPQFGDTTVGNSYNVYVKFYDDEFYPKYVVNYESELQVFRPRRQYYRF